MEKTVKVSEEHIWVAEEDQHLSLGLTNYRQSELGQILSVELPGIGENVEKGEPFAELESVATVSELIAPVSGMVLAVNADLETQPSLINEDPYREGWLIEIRAKDHAEIELLMDMDEYYHFVFKTKP
jgi:glycine cleavage system H protein